MSVKRLRDSGRLRVTNTNASLSATTTVATNAHGGAFSTPWGGSITIRRACPHEIKMNLAYVASSGIDSTVHFLINGVCYAEAPLKAAFAAGMPMSRETLEDLVPGTYTWALQGSVATAGTVVVASNAANRSYLSVKEATE
jgi:hypothetical protein